VGGHCIGVDPYYLINKSISMGFNSDLIISSRRINDSMVDFVIRKFTSRIVSLRKPNNLIKVLILGYTFKENVSDTRNSKIVEVVNKLLELEYDVAVYDINVNLENDENIPLHQKRLFLKSLDEKLFDAVIIGVNHRSFKDIVNELRQKYLSKDGIIFDLTSKNSQLKPEISL
jgi:UDP-N-acetyl-D-galactosamine dehydrogenase